MRKLGIFSGSFDPVHKGHITFAEEAMRICGLETVVFMPERFPRKKPNISPISERLAELEITLADKPFLVLNAHTDQFTVDETLTELEALYPETLFTFLVGSDVALNLPNWPNSDRLTSRYDFAVGMREGDTQKIVEDILTASRIRHTVVKTHLGHLSSSALTNR